MNRRNFLRMIPKAALAALSFPTQCDLISTAIQSNKATVDLGQVDVNPNFPWGTVDQAVVDWRIELEYAPLRFRHLPDWENLYVY